MRFDSVGMFWQDATRQRKKYAEVARSMPPIPDLGWQPPREFPNLSTAKTLSIDVETYDPELTERGPGWARGKGHLVGISVAVETGHKWYFPMRHEVEKEWNFDPTHVLSWAKDYLTNERQDKIGANLLYDVGWLSQEGVNVKGALWDVQFAEALLTENEDVDLDTLGSKYLGIGKESSALYTWCAGYYGGTPNDKQRKNIYRSPPRLVGHYAEADAILPLQVLQKQWEILRSEKLLELFTLECKLIPLLIQMRQQAVRVDLDKAERLKVELQDSCKIIHKQIKDMVGFEVNTNASASLAKAFDALGLPYGRTAKGTPSFTADFLKTVEHPLGKAITEYKQRQKLIGTFIESYIQNSHVNGRVYCQFHPLRGSEGGTRSGRFASSTPNLQNIPARTELGSKIREIFIPDEGHVRWRKFDYSQIEYRFLAHFAVGERSDNIRERYTNDPETDYHEALTQMIYEIALIELSRKYTKNINFGLTYGMGMEKLFATLGVSAKVGKNIFEAYHKGAPFVRATMNKCMEEATKLGYVTTILGRRSRFDLWEPKGKNLKGVALPLDKAIRYYGNVQRAYTHKALNRRLQGSSADQMKKAMLLGYESGLFNYIGVPRITVHDELNFSDFGGVEDGYKELTRQMQECIPLRVPVLVGESTGSNWGEAK